jgi:hypothetical protein
VAETTATEGPAPRPSDPDHAIELAVRLMRDAHKRYEASQPGVQDAIFLSNCAIVVLLSEVVARGK